MGLLQQKTGCLANEASARTPVFHIESLPGEMGIRAVAATPRQAKHLRCQSHSRAADGLLVHPLLRAQGKCWCYRDRIQPSQGLGADLMCSLHHKLFLLVRFSELKEEMDFVQIVYHRSTFTFLPPKTDKDCP